MGPKVSVVMSVYNGERHLREAVDSILSQSLSDFEFIVVDDGSTDDTWEILTSYADPRMMLVRNQENVGLSRSLNRALEMAKGEYIARMDADDVSLPERLGEQVQFLDASQDVGLISCPFIEIDQESHEVRLFPLPATDDHIMANLLSGRNCLSHGATLFRRECVEQVGAYRDQFEFAQDYDLWLRIAERYKVANLEQPFYQQRIRPDRISTVQKPAQDEYARWALELAEERVTKGQDRLGARLPGSHPDTWHRRRTGGRITLSWARELYRRRRRGAAVKMLARSLLNNPLNRDLWMFSLGVLRRSCERLGRAGLRILDGRRQPSAEDPDR